ncbi:MAG: recombination regulator RecX [Endomicrobium sp.]|uniref:regulatory protein RecX n=1 Tax=Candidatus Endomicrobiellum pyrsonymphae TaxID=1408203 RepID=UPI0035748FBC|nr:recombination regulator RecX [Endomicrobium sp.]
MKIVRIEKIKFKKNMFKLFFDNSENLMVFADTIVKFGLRTKIEISENEYEDLVSYDKSNSVMSDALVLVSKRSYSSKTLYERLIQKGYESLNAAKAVKRLEELNYINDEKFSKVYAVYLSQKGKGEFVIKAELEKQGISKDLVQNALESVRMELEPYEQIIKILKTKFKKFNGKNKNEVRRVAAFFLRRGFSSEDIAKTFRNYSQVTLH